MRLQQLQKQPADSHKNDETIKKTANDIVYNYNYNDYSN